MKTLLIVYLLPFAVGASGPVGPPGSPGQSGFPGLQGDQGYTGPSGAPIIIVLLYIDELDCCGLLSSGSVRSPVDWSV